MCIAWFFLVCSLGQMAGLLSITSETFKRVLKGERVLTVQCGPFRFFDWADR